MACEQLVRRNGKLQECRRPAPIDLRYPGRMCGRCEAKFIKRGWRTLLEWEEFCEQESRRAYAEYCNDGTNPMECSDD